eukprot:GAHX01004125.1.p1 GENE.GAHX01004125.1~~GAHX01004125.1.p1  ORF type:complete len:51 (-),score=0.55 GAHX01004125.1:362-514(-)
MFYKLQELIAYAIQSTDESASLLYLLVIHRNVIYLFILIDEYKPNFIAGH